MSEHVLGEERWDGMARDSRVEHKDQYTNVCF